jgi:hypothetical protein
MQITAKRADVLAKVKTNRDAHAAAYAEALTHYKAAIVRHVDKIRADFTAGLAELVAKVQAATPDGPPPVRIPPAVAWFAELPPLESHARDYGRAIAVLEAESGETVEMDSDDLDCVVLDSWPWSEEFAAACELYKPRAS